MTMIMVQRIEPLAVVPSGSNLTNFVQVTMGRAKTSHITTRGNVCVRASPGQKEVNE
jgi:hypothetical protein